jgi:hypothetical protein
MLNLQTVSSTPTCLIINPEIKPQTMESLADDRLTEEEEN